MNAFDKVIGYNDIKAELMQVCDMFTNRERYEKLGAKMPRGVLMYGRPGLGKTLMANALIKESGLPSYTVRRKDASPDFTKEIVAAFAQARENAPAIVFLDDMDKFSNEDERHRDAEEYVAVQACIDESAGFDVFVLATVNDIRKLPHSLRRAGRFDREIHFYSPKKSDARRIVEHYLADKKLAADVNFDDLVKMMSYSSCSELETIINDAAIRAAFARKDSIEMNDLIASVLSMQYSIGAGWNTPGVARGSNYGDGDDGDYDDGDENETGDGDDGNDDDDDDGNDTALERRMTAIHEAGHLVASEVLKSGSVGLATIKSDGHERGGLIYNCIKINRRRDLILIALAGKAAVELYYSETCANGCRSDIGKAVSLIRDGLTESGTHGFCGIDTSLGFGQYSDGYKNTVENIITVELEKNLFKVRDIILKNKEFLEKATEALLEKEVLLASDIKAIRNSVTITAAAA